MYQRANDTDRSVHMCVVLSDFLSFGFKSLVDWLHKQLRIKLKYSFNTKKSRLRPVCALPYTGRGLVLRTCLTRFSAIFWQTGR